MHYKQYKSILSPKGGMNIYRGCSHGCIYCDSRSKCYQMEHDFEDIEIKTDAPAQLEDELRKKRKKFMIGTGAMTDPYLHIEQEIKYTRKCLEKIEKHGFGAAVLTKSDKVLRDLELLKAINSNSRAVVQITLTTADDALCKIIEPNVSPTSERVEALRIFQENGIPTVVWLGPFLPFIDDNEDNMRRLMKMCVESGVTGILNFGIGMTLREGNREYYYRKLDEFFPGLKQKYIDKYGLDYSLRSEAHHSIMNIFRRECDKNAILFKTDEVWSYIYKFEEKNKYEQISFFK